MLTDITRGTYYRGRQDHAHPHSRHIYGKWGPGYVRTCLSDLISTTYPQTIRRLPGSVPSAWRGTHFSSTSNHGPHYLLRNYSDSSWHLRRRRPRLHGKTHCPPPSPGRRTLTPSCSAGWRGVTHFIFAVSPMTRQMLIW